jgi:hypothetical protein
VNMSETVDLLSTVAAYDQRTVGKTDAVAWHHIVRDLDAALAFEAVVIHHKTSAERIKPAHVVALVKQMRQDRAMREDEQQRAERAAANAARLRLEPAPPARGMGAVAAVVDRFGVEGKAVAGAYMVGDAIDKHCPRCAAEPTWPCTSAVTGRERKIPCLDRMAR